MADKNLYNKAQKWAFNQLMKGIKVQQGAIVVFIGNVPIVVIMPTRVEPDHCPDFVLNVAERSGDNVAD